MKQNHKHFIIVYYEKNCYGDYVFRYKYTNNPLDELSKIEKRYKIKNRTIFLCSEYEHYQRPCMTLDENKCKWCLFLVNGEKEYVKPEDGIKTMEMFYKHGVLKRF